MDNVVPILLLATLGSVAGLFGGVFFLVSERWGRVISSNAVPFAAGVLISISFLDLLPEAIEESSVEVVFPLVLAVFVAVFLFEGFVVRLHHHNHSEKTAGPPLATVVVGDTIHNFTDGVVIASAYLSDPKLGLFVALATFLHENPHEVADFGLMLAGGWRRRKVLLVNLFSSLSTYLGALAVLVFSKAVYGNLGTLLAVAGGMFLYIGASDLLPEVGKKMEKGLRPAVFFLLGVLIIWVITNALSF